MSRCPSDIQFHIFRTEKNKKLLILQNKLFLNSSKPENSPMPEKLVGPLRFRHWGFSLYSKKFNHHWSNEILCILILRIKMIRCYVCLRLWDVFVSCNFCKISLSFIYFYLFLINPTISQTTISHFGFFFVKCFCNLSREQQKIKWMYLFPYKYICIIWSNPIL